MDREDRQFLFEDKNPFEKLQNRFSALHSVKSYLLSHKLILIPGALGLAILVLALVLLVRLGMKEPEAEFTTDVKEQTDETIVVDIEGAVMKPGVFSLKEGSRISDLMTEAGGLSADADRTYVGKRINRALILKDGDKVFIPTEDEVKVQSANLKSNENIDISVSQNTGTVMGASDKMIDINSASEGLLDSLPGVGAKTVEKIIAGRPYGKIEELVEKKIVTKSVFEKIKGIIVSD